MGFGFRPKIKIPSYKYKQYLDELFFCGRKIIILLLGQQQIMFR